MSQDDTGLDTPSGTSGQAGDVANAAGGTDPAPQNPTVAQPDRVPQANDGGISASDGPVAADSGTDTSTLKAEDQFAFMERFRTKDPFSPMYDRYRAYMDAHPGEDAYVNTVTGEISSAPRLHGAGFVGPPPIPVRVQGGIQAATGLGELFLASELAATPEPVASKWAAYALGLYAADNINSGLQTALTGRPTQTAGSSMISGASQLVGVPKPTADAQGDLMYALVGGIGTYQAGKVLTQRSSLGDIVSYHETGIDAASAAPNASSSVPKLLSDPLVDENILLQAEKGNPIAIQFLETNRGLMATGNISKIEYIKTGRGSVDQFKSLIDQYGIEFHPYLPSVYQDAGILIRRAEAVGNKLGAADAVHLAGSNKLGIPLYTNDLPFFKRAKDLGGDVYFLDLFPGPSGLPSRAATRAAAYVPKIVP